MLSLANLSVKCRFLLGFGTDGVGVAAGVAGVEAVDTVIVGLGFGFLTFFTLFPTFFSVFLLILVEARSVETVTAGERKSANIKYEKLLKGVLDIVVLRLINEHGSIHGYQIIKTIRQRYGIYFSPSTLRKEDLDSSKKNDEDNGDCRN